MPTKLTSNQITFVDITDESCSISGSQIFKYNTGSSTPVQTTITLTGNVNGVTISQWQYYNPSTDTYLPYPNGDNTGNTLVVSYNDNIFYNENTLIFSSDGDIAKIKLTTSDDEVFDIFTMYKVRDGSDGYSITVTPPVILLSCDMNGNLIPSSGETEVYDIDFAIYIGANNDRVATVSHVIGTLPNGVKLIDFREATTETNGKITIGILNPTIGSLLDGKTNATFEFEVTTEDGLVFEQHISLQKNIMNNSIIFSIYSTDGDVFTSSTNEITMRTYIYNGTEVVSPDSSEVTYSWARFDIVENEWTTNVQRYFDQETQQYDYEPCTDSYLTIYADGVWGSQSYRCRIVYNNKTYDAHYTLKDLNEIYRAEIRTTTGNVIDSNNRYVVAYVVLYKNDEEIDRLLGSIWVDSEQNPVQSGLYYKYDASNDTIKLKKYDINTSQWSDPDPEDENERQAYNYSWYVVQQDTNTRDLQDHTGNILTGKVVALTSDDLNISNTVGCRITTTDAVDLTNDQLDFIDLNDVIVSSVEPMSPTNGRFWLDTSMTPPALKIYNSNQSQWINLSENQDITIYTSKPNTPGQDGYCYKVGDIWVLDADNLHTLYGSGSILVCKRSSAVYSEADWIELNNNINVTNLLNSVSEIEQHVKVDTNGLTLIGAIEGNDNNYQFYSQLTSTELGFCQKDIDSEPRYNNDRVVWIGQNSMHARETEIEHRLSITSTDSQLGGFVFEIDEFGNLNIGKG